jgi:hypothetical protein
MYKIRFHLQNGKHYKHWQVIDKKGNVQYYNPNDYELEMFDCKLVSQPAASKKVHDSGVKDVCGWIKCEKINIAKSFRVVESNCCLLSYNPIFSTNWHLQGFLEPVTGQSFEQLFTISNKVYLKK